MSVAVGMAALLAGAMPVAVLNPVARVELSGPAIRLADVASLSGVDSGTRARLSGRIVARLPEGRTDLTLSRAALADLLRRTVPALEVVEGNAGGLLRLRLSAAAAPDPGKRCFALSHPVDRGASLTLEDVEPVACDVQASRAPVLFDGRGAAVRASRALPEHSYLGPIALPRERGVDRGDRLILRSVAGPVRIERSVVALQAGRPGRRIFVRDEDGQAIAAPLSGHDEEKGQ